MELESIPLVFVTEQVYTPSLSVTPLPIVRVLLYVADIVFVTVCVCWYSALSANITQFFLQVTVVAGPPVEVQVNLLFPPLFTTLLTVGKPDKVNDIHEESASTLQL